MDRINKIRVNDIDYLIGGSGGGDSISQWPEIRYKNNNDPSKAPDIKVSERFPQGWELYPTPVSEGEYAWMTTAIIDSNNNLSGPTNEWSKPCRVTGVNGEQGPAGTPGVDLELRYSIGTKSSYDAKWDETIKKKRNPTSDGWTITYPKVTPEKPQIWFIQARILHTEIGDEGTLEDGTWTEPSHWTGGGAGPQGSRGQIIYPAGVYDVNKEYKSDEFKAPYVFVPATDPSKGGRQFPAGYFILRAKQWKGTDHGGKTPAEQDYIDNNSGINWTKMENFRAIYADVGVFGNALVGSAVFNGYYMFSQQGITTDGNQTPIGSTHYENFNPKDPYNPNNLFRPNFCINFLTGEVWAGAGKIYFNKEGGGHLANKNIKWDSNGNPEIKGTITAENGKIGDFKIDKGRLFSTSGNFTGEMSSQHIGFSGPENQRTLLSPNGLEIYGNGITMGYGSTIGGLSLKVMTHPFFPIGLIPIQQDTGYLSDGGFIINTTGKKHTYIFNQDPINGSQPQQDPANIAYPGRIVFVRNIRGGIELQGKFRHRDSTDIVNIFEIPHKNITPRIFICDDDLVWNEY